MFVPICEERGVVRMHYLTHSCCVKTEISEFGRVKEVARHDGESEVVGVVDHSEDVTC